MRITGITSRIISYDVSAIYGEVGPPQEISADYRYSFDTFHTDEGIDGHSMQFGWMGEGQAMGHALHQAYGRFLIGRDVDGARASLAGPAPPEPPRVQPDRHSPGRRSTSRSGTSAARPPACRSRGSSASRAITIPTYATAITVNPTPGAGLRGGAAPGPTGLSRLQDPVLGRPGSRHSAVPGRARGGRARLPAVPGRRRVLLVDRGARRRLRARRAELPLVRGAASRPPGLPAEAPGRRDPDAGAHERDVAAPRAARGASDRRRRPRPRRRADQGGHHRACARPPRAAELFGYNLEIHGLGAPLLDAANLHVALSIENCEFSEGHEALYHEGLVGTPLAIDGDGLRHLPDAPGLGVEMDWTGSTTTRSR